MSKRALGHMTLALLFIWLCSFHTTLASPEEQLRSANQLYDTGQFAEAAAIYANIEPKTAHVYFNLGNAHFRQGELGKAILNYERSLRLSPRDPDTQANLKFAQRQKGVEQFNTPRTILGRLKGSIMERRTPNEWCVYELICIWLIGLGISCRIWFPKLRTMGMIISGLSLAGLIGTVFALYHQTIQERTSPHAIVIANKTEARFAPLLDSTVHFELVEGTKIVVKENRGNWWFVERADTKQGWIQSATAECIGLY